MWRVVQEFCPHWRRTYRPWGGFWFSACHRPPGRQPRGKELADAAWLTSGRCRLFGDTRPGAGVELGPPTVCVVGSLESPVVCGKQEWGSRAPGAVLLLDSGSKLAHSKTLRDLEGAVRGRGSVWRAAACRRFIGPAGTEGDPGRPVCRVAALGPDGRG